MAKVETIRLVDDISGDEADETVDFRLDGRLFEIDLTSAHAGRLRERLAPFVSAARTTDTPGAHRARGRASGPPAASSGAASPSSGAGSDAATREHNRAVRAWARENGFTVSERGRIPSGVVEAYRRGTPDPAQTGTPAPAEAPRPDPQPDPQPDTEQESAEQDVPAVEQKSDAKQAPTVEFSG